MRGKARVPAALKVQHRITPAYAGKRRVKIPIAKCPQDHPRLCGEKSIRFSGIALAVGSPPPMRGKAIVLCSSPRGHRITPAYAGKSFLCHADFTTQLDHPRLCGEKMFSCWSMRTTFRITPAYAGKSST